MSHRLWLIFQFYSKSAAPTTSTGIRLRRKNRGYIKLDEFSDWRWLVSKFSSISDIFMKNFSNQQWAFQNYWPYLTYNDLNLQINQNFISKLYFKILKWLLPVKLPVLVSITSGGAGTWGVVLVTNCYRARNDLIGCFSSILISNWSELKSSKTKILSDAILRIFCKLKNFIGITFFIIWRIPYFKSLRFSSFESFLN